MNTASYNDIAEWYDRYLQSPIYQEVLLPALLAAIGNVQGQNICDLACGQGWFARELARRGAHVTGVDSAERLLNLARHYEQQALQGIVYQQDDAQLASSLADSSFAGCVCVMALMDIPDLQAVFHTVKRIIKPGGWFVFAITHPCFEVPFAQWMTTDDGQVVRAVRGYFQEGFWKTESGGVRSRVGAHHRTLSTYLNALVNAKLALESVTEPMATGERVAQVPGNREVPSLLIIRARAI